MKYLFIRYRKSLYKFIKYELLSLQYKYIFLNTLLPFFIRSKALYTLNLFNKNASIVKLKNICLYSYKFHSVFKFFHYGRFSTKMLFYDNKLPGIKKISW